MISPAELLEQALAAHGDTLYRVALLAGGDERAAEALLRALVAERVAVWREAPPITPPDEPELLRGLVAAAVAAQAKQPARRGPPAPRARGALSYGPFAIGGLPLQRRLALGLHLLLGYDAARIARVLAVDEPAALDALTSAVRTLAPAAGHSLTDRVSGDLCAPVRAALADPASTARHGAAVRGHLATCSLCRSFDHAWGETLHAVEAQLRDALRGRTLPPPLAARLVAAARPARRRLSPTLRLALPPLAVLALIAALVLPGFMQAPVSVVQREDGPAVDPQQLLAMAVERHASPPDRGAIWHGRYQTQWYFDDGVYAPLTAEIWLDPRNPARHRMQITHADGGAPYELQLGNGRNRLYYALDAVYAPAIYGSLPTRARPESPALLSEAIDEAGLRRARDERLATGPWAIAPSYLRQAQQASDLRVLGRQRDRGRTVQILSFSGISPLAPPPDAEGAAEPVTVLLAIDTEDGLLRSATELAGPAGAEQISRVTWRLLDEQWLSANAQIESAFDIGRAWTGMGDFSETGRHESADLAMPLIAARAVGDPARLLSSNVGPFWLPARAPAGVDRALLLWSDGDAISGNPPQGLVYLGPGRRMVIVFNLFRPVNGAPEQVGPWTGTLRPAATNRYRLFLARERDESLVLSGRVDPSANVLIDAYGFSRDELLATAESMRPFDIGSLEAQDTLFAGRRGDAEARAELIRVALDARPSGDSAYYVRARRFSRQADAPPTTRRDPYQSPAYNGRPPTTIVEEWVAASERAARYVREIGPSGAQAYQQAYLGETVAWFYSDVTRSGYRYPSSYAPATSRLPYAASAALEMLGSPRGELAMSRLPGGGSLFRWSEQASDSPRYGYLLRVEGGGEPYLYDLYPITMTTELQLSPVGEAEAVRVYAVDRGGQRNLVESYEIVDQYQVALADAPAPLRDGDLPEALYMRDYTSYADVNADTTPVLTTLSLADALATAPGDIYLLDNLEPVSAEVGPANEVYTGSSGALDEAVGQRLAVRLNYWIADLDGRQEYLLRLTQGPAGPLAAFLQAAGLPWTSSELRRITLAGREVEAWVGQGEQAYLVAELGETLLVAEVFGETFSEGDLEALATMRLAERP